MKILYTLSLALLVLFGWHPLQAHQKDWKAEEYFENSSSQKNAAADLLKCIEIEGVETILDVGCGDGKITADLAARVPMGSVVGIDISPAMISFAKATFPKTRYPNLQFFLKDAEQLKFDQEFDLIFSFTAMQWIQNHSAFLERAYDSLKPSGVLALTMPMGLPATLEQAVTEVMAYGQWSSYFQGFSTGWNFIEDQEYGTLLSMHQFTPIRLAVIPQKDIFPSREIFEKFITQWFPYLTPLPEKLRAPFMKRVLDRFLELEPPFPHGEVHFKIRRLEVVAVKN